MIWDLATQQRLVKHRAPDMLACARMSVFAFQKSNEIGAFAFPHVHLDGSGGQSINLAGTTVRTGVFGRPVRDDVVDPILSETAGARGERKLVQRLNRMACIDG